MITKVVVQEREEFDAFLAGLLAKNSVKKAPGEAEYGSLCAACHSKNNKPGPLAPGFGGLYGSKRKMLDPDTGKIVEITADDAYIRESILNPSALVSRQPSATGTDFVDNLMPKTFGLDLEKEQIDGLIEFIKGLK